MTDIFPPPFSVVVQKIDALENTETQHGHLMALMRHRAMLAAAPQPPAVEQPQVEQEPVAWMFQHDETGRIMYVDAQQVEWGFEKGNPRWQKIYPVYLNPQPKREPLTDEAEHQCPYPKANPSTRNAWLDGWEAAERAHGIGGEA